VQASSRMSNVTYWCWSCRRKRKKRSKCFKLSTRTDFCPCAPGHWGLRAQTHPLFPLCVALTLSKRVTVPGPCTWPVLLWLRRPFIYRSSSCSFGEMWPNSHRNDAMMLVVMTNVSTACREAAEMFWCLPLDPGIARSGT